ncbi:MAG: hypothetical protein WBB00_30635 [Mycobacterium sp.]
MWSDPDIVSAEPLFEAFPQWRILARREVNRYGEEYVLVEFDPPPAADVDEGLWITCDSEITVGFAEYHEHFWAWIEEDIRDRGALDFVRGILEERVAVATLFDGDEAVAYTTVETGEPNRPVVGHRTYNRMRVRSWNGTFNRDP